MPNKQIKQRGRKSAHRPQSSPLAVGMHEINVRTWEEFEENLRDLKQAMDGGLLGFLFRGHGDSRWQLDTTLQRNGHEKYPVRKYYDLISRIKPQIETFTGTNWETPAYSDLETLFREYELFSRRLSFGDLPAYKYMVYLRHHGFPSPLMDWTRSPYVAAYFAFRRITGKHVCIYVFWSRHGI